MGRGHLQVIINIPCSLEQFIAAFDGALDDVPYVIFEGIGTRKIITEWTAEAAADLRKMIE